MPTDFDSFIESENHANFTIVVGKELWEHINKKLLKAEGLNIKLKNAHKRCCYETDYCYVCDSHPSHGHEKDCPLK